MSGQDDIRAKRLAKLNRLAALSPAPSESPKPSDGGKESTKESSPSTKESTKESSPSTKESPKLKVDLETFPEKVSRLEAASSSVSVQSAGSLSSQQPKDSNKLLKNWIASDVSEVLMSYFTPHKNDSKHLFVENSYIEMSKFEEANPEGYNKLFLEDDLVDRIILENLTEIGRESPLTYLYQVWDAARISLRKVNNKIALKKTSIKPYQEELFSSQKFILKEILRLTASYGLVNFQVPDMFIGSSLSQSLQLLVNYIVDGAFTEFCLAVIEQAKLQESAIEILDIWFPFLSRYLTQNKITDLTDQRYISILNFYLLVLSDQEIASVFTQIPSFFAENTSNPANIEIKSLLGPIFKVGPFGIDESMRLYDRSLGDKSKYQIAQTQQTVQFQHRGLIDTHLFPIVDKIIRGGEQSRDDLLKYFSAIINANHLRVATQPDYSKLSSHAFIINITMILVKLSLPFLKSDFKKLNKIDIDYFNKNVLLDISEETRINATTKEANEYFENTKSTTKANFISDCFFLTLTYVHYGVGGLSLAENKFTELIGYLEKKVKAIQAQREKMTTANNAVFERMVAIQLEKLEKQLNFLRCEEDSCHCFFLNEEFQLDIFDYVSSSCVFLTRVIDPSHSHPAAPLKIPLIPDVEIFEGLDNAEALRNKAPKPFRYYPEYSIESIINYISYIIKYMKNPLQSNNQRLNFFIDFAVTLLRCPELISNPHLKGKLVECLFYGSTPMYQSSNSPGFMMQSFMSNKTVLDHMLYALLDFYVMVEKTGASSQFYDKFNSRYHISAIIERLWQIDHYRNQLKVYSEIHEEFFIRFVARMLNDTTYLLDESLRELSKIHHLGNEIQRRTEQGNLETAVNSEFDEVSFEELNNRLLGSERQARSFIGLSNKTIELFDLFTKEVPKAFTKSEIVDRLAGMLDFNLNQLVGPKYGELKVKNPEKYQFNPRKLLTDISKIFINLSKEQQFAVAVSRDARSFRKQLFYKAQSILSKYGQLDSDSLKVMTDFAEKADSIRLEEEEEELELGDDIPDEFLDPLMFTLMVDPVILPSSKVSIDRSTIKAHLLSDATDPFNRVPLKLEDVVPDVSLKQKIDAFKKQKKQKLNDPDLVMEDT